jgi:CubicO group peptidase (beta-lactamase class C family)
VKTVGRTSGGSKQDPPEEDYPFVRGENPMKRTRSLRPAVALCALLAIAGLTVPALAGPFAGRTAQDGSYGAIDAYIQEQMARLNLPGASLAIVEGNEIAYLKGYGEARPGGAAPTSQTPFFIGSLTKSFTALAVMQLVEVGKIELDAPVQRYLPWFTQADPQAAARITVRHLLNQTSGLSQAVGMIPLADFDEGPDAAERQARELVTFQPTRPPGSAWEYSNMNFNLLGLIIEAASGESYEAYIRNHIFAPLEMRHSYTSKADAQQDGLAEGYRFWFGVPIAAPHLPVPSGSLPSGQLISSAEDMAHYLIAHLNGGRHGAAQILSPHGIAEMHRPAVTAAAMGIDMGAYGMGWFVEDTAQGTRIWHNGQVPDYFAYMALLPEQKRGMVLLVNANQMMLNFALAEVGAGAADLLAGAPPASFPWGVIPWTLRSFLLIPVIQIGGVIATLRRLRGWQRDPGRRPGHVRLWLLHIVLPILLNLALVVFAVGLLASDLWQMILLFMPDLSWLILICGGFALVWIFVRTWLILRAEN